MINFSPTGAKLLLSAGEEIVNPGVEIFLDMFSHSGLEQVSIKGIVKWMKRQESGVECGVQFKKKLDENAVNALR